MITFTVTTGFTGPSSSSSQTVSYGETVTYTRRVSSQPVTSTEIFSFLATSWGSTDNDGRGSSSKSVQEISEHLSSTETGSASENFELIRQSYDPDLSSYVSTKISDTFTYAAETTTQTTVEIYGTGAFDSFDEFGNASGRTYGSTDSLGNIYTSTTTETYIGLSYKTVAAIEVTTTGSTRDGNKTLEATVFLDFKNEILWQYTDSPSKGAAALKSYTTDTTLVPIKSFSAGVVISSFDPWSATQASGEFIYEATTSSTTKATIWRGPIFPLSSTTTSTRVIGVEEVTLNIPEMTSSHSATPVYSTTSTVVYRESTFKNTVGGVSFSDTYLHSSTTEADRTDLLLIGDSYTFATTVQNTTVNSARLRTGAGQVDALNFLDIPLGDLHARNPLVTSVEFTEGWGAAQSESSGSLVEVSEVTFSLGTLVSRSPQVQVIYPDSWSYVSTSSTSSTSVTVNALGAGISLTTASLNQESKRESSTASAALIVVGETPTKQGGAGTFYPGVSAAPNPISGDVEILIFPGSYSTWDHSGGSGTTFFENIENSIVTNPIAIARSSQLGDEGGYFGQLFTTPLYVQ